MNKKLPETYAIEMQKALISGLISSGELETFQIIERSVIEQVEKQFEGKTFTEMFFVNRNPVIVVSDADHDYFIIYHIGIAKKPTKEELRAVVTDEFRANCSFLMNIQRIINPEPLNIVDLADSAHNRARFMINHVYNDGEKITVVGFTVGKMDEIDPMLKHPIDQEEYERRVNNDD